MVKEQVPEADNPLDARIFTIRGERVMLDSDLAAVYGVETKALNQAVNRNQGRFPEEFSFQLTVAEWDALRSQIVTLKTGRGQHRKYMPRVFTEHGAIMLAAVLNSERAIAASIQVVQAFVRLRRLLTDNAALGRRMDELEAKYTRHDRTITVIFHELKKLVAGDDQDAESGGQPKRRIGFRTSKDGREGKTKAKKKKAGK